MRFRIPSSDEILLLSECRRTNRNLSTITVVTLLIGLPSLYIAFFMGGIFNLANTELEFVKVMWVGLIMTVIVGYIRHKTHNKLRILLSTYRDKYGELKFKQDNDYQASQEKCDA